MGGLVLAWLAGESMIVYRWVKHKAPPPPGALLEASLLFIGLAVIAEYEPARSAATLFGWGLDLAVLMQLVGKEPAVDTNWPPLCIPDTQFMPSKSGGIACPGGAGTSGSSSASSTSTATKTKATKPPTLQLFPGTPKVSPSGVHV
jgi:hypothetical protein